MKNVTIEKKIFWEYTSMRRLHYGSVKSTLEPYTLYLVKVDGIRVDAFLNYKNALAKKERLEADANK